jgi:hypothetical protein
MRGLPDPGMRHSGSVAPAALSLHSPCTPQFPKPARPEDVPEQLIRNTATRSFRRLLLVLLALFVSAAAAEITRAEEEVYAALLNSAYNEGHSDSQSVGSVIVAAGTVALRPFLAHRKGPIAATHEWLAEASDAVVADFVRENREQAEVVFRRRLLKPELKLILADEATLARVLGTPAQGDGWIRLDAMYPNSGGVLRFSRVGFDTRANQALVYIEHQCGPGCGAGRLVLLTRLSGAWYLYKTVVVSAP